jgi:hypothetical protein
VPCFPLLLTLTLSFSAPNDLVSRPSALDLLQIILDRNLSVLEIVNSPVLATPADLAEAKSMLSQSAQDMGRTDVVEILNSHNPYMADIGSVTPRTSVEVPEVMPVQVTLKV